MKMRLWICAAVIGLLAMSSPTFGDNQGRTVRIVSPDTAVGVPLADCGGFQILADWGGLYSVILHFDAAGDLIHNNALYRTIGESIYYNSTDPAKAVSGGPGEMQPQLIEPATGTFRFSGSGFKIRIPGAGVIFHETGLVVMQCDPYTFANCTVVKDSGQGALDTADALCAYLE